MFVRLAVSEKLKQTIGHIGRIPLYTLVILTNWVLCLEHNLLGLKNYLMLDSALNTNFLNLFSNSMGVVVDVDGTPSRVAS